jgi:putative endopeptidase
MNESLFITNDNSNCGDNFYNYINDEWINNTEIPHDNQRWSVFQMLQNETNDKIKLLLESPTLDSEYHKISIIFKQAQNEDARNDSRNYDIIKYLIDKITSTTNVTDLFNLIMDYELQFNLLMPFGFAIQSDFKNASNIILHITSSGLNLPDRDYYLTPEKEHIIIKYKKFIKDYLKLFDLELFNYNDIIKLEKQLAEKTYTKVQKRNPDLLNNLTTYSELIAKYPNLTFIEKIFIKAQKTAGIINITNPKYVKFVSQLIDTIDLDIWKQYFIFNILVGFHHYLNNHIYKCYFNFFNKELQGTLVQKELSKQSLDLVDELFGELVGKMYVESYFDIESKKLVLSMVDKIKACIKLCLKNNDWMEQTTKTKALEKLNKMTLKIGYPEKYEKNYTFANVNKTNCFLQNILNIRQFLTNYKLKRLYTKLDKTKWFMNAHSINAYYSPSFNEIVFPAGILQPPFFSRTQSHALNFGGIGVIIGHEITHGFDDQGSKFDADGNLCNWWTFIDRQKFNDKTRIIQIQYDSYVHEGSNVNGLLTLGENIADIGGMELAYKAFIIFIKLHNLILNEKEFFSNYANVWKVKARKEDSLQRLLIDPHSPPIHRVNGVVRNINAFYKVFDIKESDALYLSPNQRARIWT